MNFIFVTTRLFLQSLRAIIDPSNEPPLLCLIHPCDTGPPQMLHELGQRDPPRRVHVLVVLVLDEFLVHGVGLNALCTEPIDDVRYIKGREELGGRTSVKAT